MAGLIACLLGGVASAQFWPRGAGVTPAGPPQAEFHMGRLAYSARGCAGSRGYCNPCGRSTTRTRKAHFLPAVERMTRIEVAPDSQHVPDARRTKGCSTIRGCCCSSRSQGGCEPSADELVRLREYLMRGGFLVVDDFHGEGEWARVRESS